MKKHDYYIKSKKMHTCEASKDAKGNIIIPTQYLIKESDTNEQKGQKNRMWLAWQKRRNIEPVTDLPNSKEFASVMSRMKGVVGNI